MKSIPSVHNQTKYKLYKNKLTSVILHAKKAHYSSLFSEIYDSKVMWKNINKILGRTAGDTKPEDYYSHEGTFYNGSHDIAEGFNDYFTSVAGNLAEKIPNNDIDPLSFIVNHVKESFFIVPTTEDEVLSKVSSLKNKKSSGLDNISNVVIKHIAIFIAAPLVHIINLSFLTGCFPSELKIAKVIPIHKSGKRDVFTNYRPISLLPVISKLIEFLMHDRLVSFIDKHDIIVDNQFGFRKKHSTSLASLIFTNDVSSAIDNKEDVVSLFIDLSKAFDTLDHTILLSKLNKYGIRGISLDWFKSYLSDRKQSVQYGGATSSVKSLSTGVPQGSVLGPLLFLIYINDICNSTTQFKYVLFADDTTVYLTDKDYNNGITRAASEFSNLITWFNTNRLSLNLKKTKLMVFTYKNVDYENIHIDLMNTSIRAEECTKFLGLLIDRKLSWKDHISYICNKVSRFTGIFYRLKDYLPLHILLLLYNTLILPHLSYGIILWGNANPTTIHRITIMQNRIFRLIYNAPFRSSTSPLFQASNCLNISNLYTFNIGIFMYKLSKNLLPNYFHNFFCSNLAFHHYNTRTKNNLCLPFTRTNLAHAQLRVTGVHFWNSISNDLKTSPTLNLFKKKLKSQLVNML